MKVLMAFREPQVFTRKRLWTHIARILRMLIHLILLNKLETVLQLFARPTGLAIRLLVCFYPSINHHYYYCYYKHSTRERLLRNPILRHSFIQSVSQSVGMFASLSVYLYVCLLTTQTVTKEKRSTNEMILSTVDSLIDRQR